MKAVYKEKIAEKHAFIPYVYIVVLREIDVKIDLKILLKTWTLLASNYPPSEK